MHRDARGLEVTAASSAAAAALDDTVAGYSGLRLDTGERLKRALAADPQLVLAHILKGYFMMLMGKRPMVARAVAAADAADAAIAAAGANPRERRHLEALRVWTQGDQTGAIARWEAILAEHPRDLVALKLAQYGTFYFGDNARMCAVTERALPAWNADLPGYGFVLGSHAFGLEESGRYEEAERAGRRAVELNRADVWSAHAVAHVLEMQNRQREGIAWIDGLDDAWDGVNNFAFHIRWHRCLYHVDLEQYDRVLELYDREVRPESTDEYLDITNAIAMLWRLEQAGVDVGARWDELAERSAAHIDDHMMTFADVHYIVALARRGGDGIERWMQSARGYAQQGETQSGVMAEIGLALGEAAVAHRGGDYARAYEALRRGAASVRLIGGSHAQRDLFAQMTIDAALKAGKPDAVRGLLLERTQRRPGNVWAWRQLAQADAAMAPAATANAERLLQS